MLLRASGSFHVEGTRAVGIEFEEDTPNVVTEARLRQLLAKGYRAEVVCRTDPERKHGTWYGDWIIRAVDEERTVERVLVTVPRHARKADEIEPRVFRTLNGLFSFMLQVGFTHVHIPCHRGGRSAQALPSDVVDTDND